MLVSRDMLEPSFPDFSVLQGDCLKSLSFIGFRHSENILWLYWRTQFYQVSLRLACAIG